MVEGTVPLELFRKERRSTGQGIPTGHLARPAPHPAAGICIEINSPAAAVATWAGILMF